jgi:hypothetical protein
MHKARRILGIMQRRSSSLYGFTALVSVPRRSTQHIFLTPENRAMSPMIFFTLPAIIGSTIAKPRHGATVAGFLRSVRGGVLVAASERWQCAS